MRFRIITIAAIAALSLAACESESESGDTSATAVAEAARANIQSSPVLLGSDGLMVQATPAGEAQTLALGAPREETVTVVAEALGAQPRETGTMSDCGAGAMDYVAWDRGLQLFFQHGALAGWESTAPDLNTASDLHAGSSVEDLRAMHPDVEIQETTVGYAFILGDMYGLLDENQTRIERIRMGVNCDAH